MGNVPAQADVREREERRLTLWALFACIALPALLYWNGLGSPFLFDDLSHVRGNRAIERWSADLFRPETYARKNYPYRPWLYVTLYFNHVLGQSRPFGYHVLNLAVHIAVTLLLFALARELNRLAGGAFPPWFPLAAALLFAAHPGNTESVTYTIHREDSMATAFTLSAFLLFCRSRSAADLRAWLSLSCFALGLLSKETAATFPLLALMLDLLFLRPPGSEPWAAKLRRHAPFWLLLSAYALFRFRQFGPGDTVESLFASKWTPAGYFLVQPGVILRYLRLLLFPWGFSIDHGVAPVPSFSHPRFLLPAGAILLVLGASLWRYRRDRSLGRVQLFAWLWFFLTLAPTSSVLPINDAMADRRLYLPGIGFALFLGGLYFPASPRPSLRAGRALALAALHVLVLGVLTARRNRLYNDPILLWEEAVRLYPDNDRAHYNLAPYYADRKEDPRAIEHYEKAIALNPVYDQAHVNLANLYYRKQDYARAELHYRKALELNPGSPRAWNNLGNLCYAQNRLQAALQCYGRASQLNPALSDPFFYAGLIQLRAGDPARALSLLLQASALDPDNAEAHNALAHAYAAQKNYAAARAELQKALALLPGNPQILAKIQALQKAK